MPWKRKRYPANWEAIRERIRARAGDRCEGTPQHPHCRARNHQPHPETGSMVVCTVAHLYDPEPMAVQPSNLAFLCQRCHLSWDRPHHMEKQRLNRLKKKAAIQPPLPLEDIPHRVKVTLDLDDLR